MAYFHILIELNETYKNGYHHEEHDIDIPEADKSKIIENVVVPYISGAEFLFRGLSLTKSEIRRLLITKPEVDTNTIKVAWRERNVTILGESAAFDKEFASEITLDFINEAKAMAVPVVQEQIADDLLPHLHSKIRDISYQKYKDRHYADAVESAFKEINDRLKKLYRKHKNIELDGDNLFAHVFNDDPAKTLLKVDDLSTESGKDEQEGYRFLLMGAWSSQRNPKAHANLHLTEDEAYDRLILASMLMKRIDRAIAFTFDE